VVSGPAPSRKIPNSCRIWVRPGRGMRGGKPGSLDATGRFRSLQQRFGAKPTSSGRKPLATFLAATSRALFELAVFAAPTVEPNVHRTAITRRLAYDTGPDSGQRTAACLRDFVTALHAIDFSLTCRHACPRSHHAVHNGVVDLVLDRPVRGPTTRHCRCPTSRPSRERHIGACSARSKDANLIGVPK